MIDHHASNLYPSHINTFMVAKRTPESPSFRLTTPQPLIESSAAVSADTVTLRAPSESLKNDKLSHVGAVLDISRAEKDKAQMLENKIEQKHHRLEQAEISKLASRDREVRAHEQAHAAIGGLYAGAPRYQLEQGPDGVHYAVSGEVSIDVSKAATPQETIRKAQVVRQAALAPAEPSPQDRQVAAAASRLQTQAVQELRLDDVESREHESEQESEEENHAFDLRESASVMRYTRNDLGEETRGVIFLGSESDANINTLATARSAGSQTYETIAKYTTHTDRRSSLFHLAV